MRKPLSAQLSPLAPLSALPSSRLFAASGSTAGRPRAIQPLFRQGPRSARQGPLRAVVLNYLQRTALASGSRGALSLEQSLYAVEAAARETKAARYDFAASAQNDALTLAARLLAMPSPRAPIAQAAVAAIASSAPLSLQKEMKSVLQSSLNQEGKVRALARLLDRPLILAVLEAHLHELQAVNKILEDWGKHLRKLAKLDKVAHERAVKKSRASKEQRQADELRARDLAGHALKSLELHFEALGVQSRRSGAAASAHGPSDIAQASPIDTLSFGLSFAEAHEALQPWPNASLLAALSPPQDLGVRIAGLPRLAPGRRIYGQPV